MVLFCLLVLGYIKVVGGIVLGGLAFDQVVVFEFIGVQLCRLVVKEEICYCRQHWGGRDSIFYGNQYGKTRGLPFDGVWQGLVSHFVAMFGS